MIEEADLDNDGKVSFEEFKKLLMRWKLFLFKDTPFNRFKSINIYLL
jgi:hypothetical protein